MGSLSNPYNAVLVSQCSQSATTLNYFRPRFPQFTAWAVPRRGLEVLRDVRRWLRAYVALFFQPFVSLVVVPQQLLIDVFVPVA